MVKSDKVRRNFRGWGNESEAASIGQAGAILRATQLEAATPVHFQSGRMSYPYFKPIGASGALLIAVFAGLLAPVSSRAAQVAAEQSNGKPSLPPVTKEASSPKAAAYYHFALGHLYEEMAGTYGNRSDYVNKAIENYRLAMKEDPGTSFLVQDIAELYRVSGRTREAVEEAQNALKANPDDLNARRVLAHIYTQEIGDAQASHIDEGMVRRAIEQYKIISDKDPKDVDSLVMMGRLDRVLENSVEAEAAFKKVLTIEPDNEDAVTGLASVYSDRGDAKGSSALLERLTKKNPSARSYLALATNYESMREYGLAADAYKKAIELDATHTEWNQALAQDEALAGHFDDALKTYQVLADASPQDASPYVGMAQIYREKKELTQARKAIEKAKQLDADSPEVRYSEVGLLEEEGRTADAIAALKGLLDSLSKRGSNPAEKSYRERMTLQLGALYRENEQYENAVETFRQIPALDPEAAPQAEAEVIETYRLAKEYAKAQQEADAALKKNPNDRTIRGAYAQLLADQGKTDQSVAELKKLLDGKNDRQTYLAIAEVYQKAKNFGEMHKDLDVAEKLSQTNDDKASVLFVRGAGYEREKKFDLAEKTFRKVLEMDPNNASALNYLGYMLADQNSRLEEAQDFIKRAIKLQPENYAFLDSLGWVYFHQNKLNEAEQQLTRSLQLSSKDPTIHDHLGDVYFKQGKIKDAIAQWQTSLKAMNSASVTDVEPDEMAKVQKKLDSARVRLAKEQRPKQSGQ